VAAYHLGRCAPSMGFPRESRAGSMRIACESRTVPVTCIVIPHKKQATLIKERLKRHQSSSPTPIVEALRQLAKGAQIMAASAALMQSQVTAL
jgi:hypothetical protein